MNQVGKRTWMPVVLFALAVCVLLFSLGWQQPRNTIVISEPLLCYTMEEQVVCFDGLPRGQLVCQSMDNDIVLCSPES